MWNREQKRALADLVGLPPNYPRLATPGKSSVAIDDVIRLGGLPEPPQRGMVGRERWLGGSAITSWLCGGWGSEGPVDYDFCFASVEALNQSARELMAAGYIFRCFWSFKTICLLCGRAGQLVRRDRVEGAPLPLPRVRCMKCGDFGGIDAATLEPERLLRVTPQLIQWSGMRCLELASPRGDVIQFSTLGIGATPVEVLAASDFSITQFAIDSKNLYFGPHAWTDLMRRRLRLIRNHGNLGSYFRLWKYMGRGFVPYAETFLRFHYYFMQKGRWLPQAPPVQ